MALTLEEKAAILADLGVGDNLPKPKAVVTEGQTVRDADVPVSTADKNYSASDGGVVRVRRPDYVTINIAAWEEQQAEKRRYKRYLKDLDPCGLGLYGPIDDDDVA